MMILKDISENQRVNLEPSLYKEILPDGSIKITKVRTVHEDVTNQFQIEMERLEVEADERDIIIDMTKEEVIEAFGPSSATKTQEQIIIDTERLATLREYFK